MVIPSRTGSMVTKLLLSFLTCAVKSFTACQYVCACAYYMNMRAHARGAHVSRLFAFVRGSVQTFPSRLLLLRAHSLNSSHTHNASHS